MAFSPAYSYKNISFDIKSLFEALRFIIVNTILAVIFLFLAMEEIDWSIYSSRECIKDRVIDHSPWNLRTLSSFYLKS